MKPTSRLRILDHFRRQQAATVSELSRLLGMSGANVRHHLAVLELNDLVEVVGRRQEGRGRPRQVYGISRRMLGDGLDGLSEALLAAWLEGLPKKELQAGLRRVAGLLAGPVEAGHPLSRRLALAVERLNGLHYQARWEAAATGARLILGHCPYAVLVDRHPELCQMDATLLEIRLGEPVEQREKRTLNALGLPFCAFLLSGS